MAEDDPLAMYLVVRKDRPLAFGQAMGIAGAGAARCLGALGGDQRFAGSFRAWHDQPRKVALRASEEEFDQLCAELAGAVVATEAGPALLCLPPRRKSERTELLRELRPFTDARRPAEAPPEPEGERLVYVVRPGVLRTMGKAMAQAGHAAVECMERNGPAAVEEPGRVCAAAGDEDWERVKRAPGAVVVADAGHTQVAPGTETVVALPPGAAAAAAGLERVP